MKSPDDSKSDTALLASVASDPLTPPEAAPSLDAEARIKRFQDAQSNEPPLILDDQGPGFDKEALAKLFDFSEVRLPLFSTVPAAELWPLLELAVLKPDLVEGLLQNQRDGGIDAPSARSLHRSALRDYKSEIVGELLGRGISRHAIEEFCTRVIDDKKAADLRGATGTDATTTKPAEPQRDQLADALELQPKTKRRGPKPNMGFHHAVADVVRPFLPDWKEHLEEIAEQLHEHDIESLPKWKKRNPPAKTWSRAVGNYPDVVLKALEYSLDMAARDVAEKSSETLGNPR